MLTDSPVHVSLNIVNNTNFLDFVFYGDILKFVTRFL